MNIIEFDKNKIIKPFDMGVESVIYYYDENGKIVLLKKFNDEIRLSNKTIRIDDESYLSANDRFKLYHYK